MCTYIGIRRTHMGAPALDLRWIGTGLMSNERVKGEEHVRFLYSGKQYCHSRMYTHIANEQAFAPSVGVVSLPALYEQDQSPHAGRKRSYQGHDSCKRSVQAESGFEVAYMDFCYGMQHFQ